MNIFSYSHIFSREIIIHVSWKDRYLRFFFFYYSTSCLLICMTLFVSFDFFCACLLYSFCCFLCFWSNIYNMYVFFVFFFEFGYSRVNEPSCQCLWNIFRYLHIFPFHILLAWVHSLFLFFSILCRIFIFFKIHSLSIFAHLLS